MEMSAWCVPPPAKLARVQTTAHHAIQPITYLMELVQFYAQMVPIVIQHLKLAWRATTLAPNAHQHHIASLALTLCYTPRVETVYHCAVAI